MTINSVTGLGLKLSDASSKLYWYTRKAGNVVPGNLHTGIPLNRLKSITLVQIQCLNRGW